MLDRLFTMAMAVMMAMHDDSNYANWCQRIEDRQAPIGLDHCTLQLINDQLQSAIM